MATDLELTLTRWNDSDFCEIKDLITRNVTVGEALRVFAERKGRWMSTACLATGFAKRKWGTPRKWVHTRLPMVENSERGGEDSRTDQHCEEPETPCVPASMGCDVQSGQRPDLDNVDPDHWEPLKQWASPEQNKAVEALLRFGSVAAAADALDITGRQLRLTLTELERQSAKRGWSPKHDMVRTVPDGFHVKGVSTYYGIDGEVRGQWVKTKIDQEHKLQQLLDAAQHIVEPMKGKSEPVAEPGVTNADLLTVYPMGDPHLGLYCWSEETGNSFDLEIAEANLCAAVDKLVDLAPASEIGVIVNLGDFFHSDNDSNRTMRSGHALDVDTRWAKVLRVGIRTMRRCIDRALEKHKTVRVINEIGNHDDHSSIFLGLCLANFYENNPRVEVDTSPDHFHWIRFGRCLLGVTHGNNTKPAQLQGVMSVDRAKDWGETRFRHFYCGHIHTDSVKECPGVTVETFRTMAAKDNYAHRSGYRSDRDMKLDVWHREHGRIQRHIVGIEMVAGAA